MKRDKIVIGSRESKLAVLQSEMVRDYIKEKNPDLEVEILTMKTTGDIILDRIWGLESEVSSNNIDSYVKLIRKKLDLGEGKTMIHTIRGVGYKLEAE